MLSSSLTSKVDLAHEGQKGIGKANRQQGKPNQKGKGEGIIYVLWVPSRVSFVHLLKPTPAPILPAPNQALPNDLGLLNPPQRVYPQDSPTFDFTPKCPPVPESLSFECVNYLPFAVDFCFCFCFQLYKGMSHQEKCVYISCSSKHQYQSVGGSLS